MNLRNKLSLGLILLLTLTGLAQAQKSEIYVGSSDIGYVEHKAFTLSGETRIDIEGYAGSYRRNGNDLLFYAWIINSETRKEVWNLMEAANDDFFLKEHEGRFKVEAAVTLPSGDYEVFYAGGMNYNRYNKNSSVDFEDLGDFIRMLIDEISDEGDSHRYSDNLYVTLTADDKKMHQVDERDLIDAYTKDALVAEIRVRENEIIKSRFALKAETTLKVYTIGEEQDDEKFDYAKIINMDTWEQVWPLYNTKFRHAGGGKKNIYAMEEVTLPKGNYAVYYVSDGSHSYEHWNVLPPYDPSFWGITIWTDEKEKNKVEFDANTDLVAVELTRVRDNDFLEKGFTVETDMDIRIVSIGERSYSDGMADYGWIVNAETGDKVWEFREYKSDYAGGGRKNRMINEVITLKKGDYIAYYVTDDSHAYDDWNDAPPFAQDMYGLTVLATKSADRAKIKEFEAKKYQNENVLAQLVRVRDGEYLHTTFKLDEDTKVRVLCIGEGDDGRMFDTGWIKNMETGRIVWEMTYRSSMHAGGADKNRMFDGTLILPKGEYKMYYETDGSHSYRDWNSSPPRNQEQYGISVFKK